VEQSALSEALAALGEGGGVPLEGYRGYHGARNGPLQSMYNAAYFGNVAQLVKLIGVHGRDPSSATRRATGAT